MDGRVSSSYLLLQFLLQVLHQTLLFLHCSYHPLRMPADTVPMSHQLG